MTDPVKKPIVQIEVGVAVGYQQTVVKDDCLGPHSSVSLDIPRITTSVKLNDTFDLVTTSALHFENAKARPVSSFDSSCSTLDVEAISAEIDEVDINSIGARFTFGPSAHLIKEEDFQLDARPYLLNGFGVYTGESVAPLDVQTDGGLTRYKSYKDFGGGFSLDARFKAGNTSVALSPGFSVYKRTIQGENYLWGPEVDRTRALGWDVGIGAAIRFGKNKSAPEPDPTPPPPPGPTPPTPPGPTPPTPPGPTPPTPPGPTPPTPPGPTPPTPPGPTPPPTPALKSASEHPSYGSTVTSQTGKFTKSNYTYNGYMEGYWEIKDIQKAIDLVSGKDTTQFKKLPGVYDVSYSGGVFKYTFRTANIGINVRDIAYSLSSNVNSGPDKTTVIYSNSGTPKTTDENGKPTTVLSTNGGTWTFTPEPGYEDFYKVTWDITTITDQSSLQFGSGAIPEGTIDSQTKSDVRTNFTTMASLLN